MKVSAGFVTSAVAPEQFPDAGVPEVAFCGRSNVGKSSLLNSLLAPGGNTRGKKLAHVSSTPGRTQTINFYHVNFAELRERPDLYFADLPGYGFARAPKAIVGEWPKFIGPYLEHRDQLALCISLVDSNIPPQQSDLQLIRWMKHQGRNFLVVATKTDRLGGNQLRNSLRTLEAELGVAPLPYSAKTDRGRDELWQQVRRAAEGWNSLRAGSAV